MKRILLIGVAAACGFTGRVAANPVNPYAFPLISEVQMSDSVHWSIELGGTKQVLDESTYLNVSIPYTHPPCSTNLFRLRITSTGNVFSTKIYCNADGIAVITPNSIISTKPPMPVIHPNDTIQLLDTMWNDSTNKYWCWKFCVRPVKQGNSLVSFWYNLGSPPTNYGYLYPFETTRSSIGSRGNYTTTHQMYLMDSLHNTLSQVWIYGNGYDSYWGIPYTFLKTKLISTLIYTDVVSLATLNDKLAFSCDSLQIGLGFPPASSTPLTGPYIDTLTSITDTLILPCPPAGVRATQPGLHIPNVRFSALPGSGRRITFVIAAPHHISGATVGIFTANGKELVTLKVPASGATGTYSLAWDGAKENRKTVPAGTYLCKFMVDGKAAASQSVTIR